MQDRRIRGSKRARRKRKVKRVAGSEMTLADAILFVADRLRRNQSSVPFQQDYDLYEVRGALSYLYSCMSDPNADFSARSPRIKAAVRVMASMTDGQLRHLWSSSEDRELLRWYFVAARRVERQLDIKGRPFTKMP